MGCAREPRADPGAITDTSRTRRALAASLAALLAAPAFAAASSTEPTTRPAVAASVVSGPPPAAVLDLAGERAIARARADRSFARLTPTPVPKNSSISHRASRKFSSARSAAKHRPEGRRIAPPRVRLPRGDVAAVLHFALARIGDWYRYGAAGPNMFDCSGLVMRAYAAIGVRLPHRAASMMHYGRRVTRAQLQPGDLVFPSSHHVQIYVGRGRVVEAPHAGARVRVIRMWGFMTARRLR